VPRTEKSIVSYEPDSTKNILNVTLNYSKKHLQQLEYAGYTTIFAKDIMRVCSQVGNLIKKPVVLSFDDGYEDFYKNAFPLLKKIIRKKALVRRDVFYRHSWVCLSEQDKGDARKRPCRDRIHSLDHQDNSRDSEEVAKAEIEDSKKFIGTKFLNTVANIRVSLLVE